MKRFIGFALIALLGVLVPVVPSQAVVVFAGGSGTSLDPYQVANADQLRLLSGYNAAYSSKHYVLTSNITFGPDEDLFVGIGEEALGQRFTGSFDGRNHTISGLRMSATVSRPEAGMFQRVFKPAGAIDPVVLKNFKIISPTIAAITRAGVVLVTGDAGTFVQNVHVVGGSVSSADGWHVGGLIASATGMEISDSSSSANVSITADTNTHSGLGGLIGHANEGTKIISSNSSGSVSYAEKPNIIRAASSDTSVGGLVGLAWPAIISYSSATGSVSSNAIDSDSGVGGLVGRISGGTYVKNFASGRVIDLASPRSQGIGGFSGYVQYSADVLRGNLWDIDSSGQGHDPAYGVGQVEGKSAAQLANTQTFVDAGWMSVDYPKTTGAWASIVSSYPATIPVVPEAAPTYLPQAKLSAKGSMTTLRRTSEISLEGGSGQGAVTYKSLTEATCKVDLVGVITGVSPGKCEVEVAKAADGAYRAATVTATVQILSAYQKIGMAPAEITAEEIGSIRGRYLAYVKPAMFRQLTTTAFAAFSKAQIKVITKAQLAALSTEQRKALKR